MTKRLGGSLALPKAQTQHVLTESKIDDEFFDDSLCSDAFGSR